MLLALLALVDHIISYNFFLCLQFSFAGTVPRDPLDLVFASCATTCRVEEIGLRLAHWAWWVGVELWWDRETTMMWNYDDDLGFSASTVTPKRNLTAPGLKDQASLRGASTLDWMRFKHFVFWGAILEALVFGSTFLQGGPGSVTQSVLIQQSSLHIPQRVIFRRVMKGVSILLSQEIQSSLPPAFCSRLKLM